VIHAALQHKHIGYYGSLQMLVEKCPENLQAIDKLGRTPYHHLGNQGEAAVQYLLSLNPIAGRYADDSGSFPLHYVVQSASKNVAQRVLVSFPKAATMANESGDMPMHVACASDNHQATKLLLAAAPTVLKIENNLKMDPFAIALLNQSWHCYHELWLHDPAYAINYHATTRKRKRVPPMMPALDG